MAYCLSYLYVRRWLHVAVCWGPNHADSSCCTAAVSCSSLMLSWVPITDTDTSACVCGVGVGCRRECVKGVVSGEGWFFRPSWTPTHCRKPWRPRVCQCVWVGVGEGGRGARGGTELQGAGRGPGSFQEAQHGIECQHLRICQSPKNSTRSTTWSDATAPHYKQPTHLPWRCIAGRHSGWEAAVVDKALTSTIKVQHVVRQGCCRGLEVQVARANS